MTDLTNKKPLNPDRVLIIDSDTMACELLQFRLESEGFKVEIVKNGDEIDNGKISKYHLLIADLSTEHFNGIKFAHNLRSNSETANLPLIFVSAKPSEDDIVEGLDAGADDYLTKPFSSREMLARVKSVLRRRRMMTARRMSSEMTFKGLTVDFSAGTVKIDGEQINLTRTEYLILAMFLRHRNQYFERGEIQNEAWEEEGASARAVDTNISRLRKKLGEYGRYIVNRQGFGYGFIEH
ncbi:MAG: response regulator transcription factor [Paramuribaculum sp.]|nr:response regulator transcription factor [Paramuribaculum sp.]